MHSEAGEAWKRAHIMCRFRESVEEIRSGKE